MENAVQKIPFFFIIGRPRSGTTLLRTLLDAHPAVIIPPEYPVILDLYKQFGKRKEFDYNAKKRFLEAFKRPQLFDFWKYEYLQVNEHALHEDMEKLNKHVSFADLLKLVYLHTQSVFKKTTVQLIGDKNPVYALYTTMLMKLFPEARFIYIYRDYRDNFVSMRKFEFEASNIVLQAYRWKYISRMMLQLQKKFPEKFLFVKYEDLASHPETEYAKVCRFLNIDYNPDVFNFYQQREQSYKIVGKETFLKYHESLTKPVGTENIGLWETKLTPREIRLADAVCRKYGPVLKYANGNKPLYFGDYPAYFGFQMYGFILYKIMLAGEFLPYRIKISLSKVLPLLVKAYTFIGRIAK